MKPFDLIIFDGHAHLLNNTERKLLERDHQGHLDQFFEAVNDEKVATIVIITNVPGVQPEIIFT